MNGVTGFPPQLQEQFCTDKKNISARPRNFIGFPEEKVQDNKKI